MKRNFQFISKSFNVTEPRNYFVNQQNFGDDLASWLISELQKAGVKATSKPKQEDFGWYFTFLIDGVEHCVVVGFQPNDIVTGDCWLGWIERNAGFVSSLIGGRKRGIRPEAVEIIDSILRSNHEIKELVWSANSEG